MIDISMELGEILEAAGLDLKRLEIYGALTLLGAAGAAMAGVPYESVSTLAEFAYETIKSGDRYAASVLVAKRRGK